MKTEREVRELRDSVLFLLDHLPRMHRLGLPAPPHAEIMFRDFAVALSWILGERERDQGDVDRVNEIVAKLRHEMPKG